MAFTLRSFSTVGVFGFGPQAPAPFETTAADRPRFFTTILAAVETVGLDLDVGRPVEFCEGGGGCVSWLVDGPASVLSAESELVTTTFIFDRSCSVRFCHEEDNV